MEMTDRYWLITADEITEFVPVSTAAALGARLTEVTCQLEGAHREVRRLEAVVAACERRMRYLDQREPDAA